LKKFILIGHPVGHSVSPAIHHAAYDELGIAAQYTTVDCPDRQTVEEQVQALRLGIIDGANVTVPHKQLAFELADEIHPTAKRVGVANVLARTEQGQIVAYNTDASALAQELSASVVAARVDAQARPSALVLGNGGAAKAAVVACQLAGITRVAVSARRFSSELGEQTWPEAQAFVELGARILPWPAENAPQVADWLSQTHLLVQATSAGMKGAQGGVELSDALPWESFEYGVAYDLVYNPQVTPFLAQAKARGHFPAGGLGMLVGQASDGIKIWLGQAPSREPLMSAARKALGL